MANNLVKSEVVSAELIETNTMTGQMVDLEGKGSFELIEKELGVPPDLVYKIKGGEKGEGGFTASLYDLIAHILGMRWGESKTVYEDKDRVKVGVPVEYFSKGGKLVEDYEEYEIDCQLLLEKSRFGWEKKVWDKAAGGYKVTAKAEIKVHRDPKHPENAPRIEVILPDEAESELYENFLTLRRNKLSKAITCAHRRLIQRAIGIKKFSANTKKDGWDREIKMKLYSFLPAEADRQAGVQAVHDLTGETLPPEKKKKEKPVETETAEKKETPAPAAGSAAAEGEHKEPEKEKEETKKTGEETGKLVCTAEGCGVEVAQIVADYSTKFYHKVLCRKHQPKRG